MPPAVNFQSLCDTSSQRLGLRLTCAPNDSTVFVEQLNARMPIFVDSKFSLRNTPSVDEHKSLSTDFFCWRSLRLCVDRHRCSIMRKNSAQQTASQRAGWQTLPFFSVDEANSPSPDKSCQILGKWPTVKIPLPRILFLRIWLDPQIARRLPVQFGYPEVNVFFGRRKNKNMTPLEIAELIQRFLGTLDLGTCSRSTSETNFFATHHQDHL
jgi:hypothetical protein